MSEIKIVIEKRIIPFHLAAKKKINNLLKEAKLGENTETGAVWEKSKAWRRGGPKGEQNAEMLI